jgi:hypothetical protein
MDAGFHNGHYANPSLHLDGATIKNDHHGPTDKKMRLSLSVFRIGLIYRGRGPREEAPLYANDKACLSA